MENEWKKTGRGWKDKMRGVYVVKEGGEGEGNPGIERSSGHEQD